MTRYAQSDVDRLLQAMVEEAERETAAYYQRNDVPPGTLAKAKRLYEERHQAESISGGNAVGWAVGAVLMLVVVVCGAALIAWPWTGLLKWLETGNVLDVLVPVAGVLLVVWALAPSRRK